MFNLRDFYAIAFCLYLAFSTEIYDIAVVTWLVWSPLILVLFSEVSVILQEAVFLESGFVLTPSLAVAFSNNLISLLVQIKNNYF